MQCHSLQALEQPTASATIVAGWRGHWAPEPPALNLDPGDFRILIVNEDMRSTDSLKCLLRDLGYRATHAAYSAHRGLILADELSPSLAILDLELPDMSGFQLARRLRAHRHQHVRSMNLLAIADCHAAGNSHLARAAGFLGCLTKPIPPLELGKWLRALGR